MIERGKGALLFEEVHTRILGRNEGGRTTGMVPSRKTDLMQDDVQAETGLRDWREQPADRT
jgi:hypothetical protein